MDKLLPHKLLAVAPKTDRTRRRKWYACTLVPVYRDIEDFHSNSRRT